MVLNVERIQPKVLPEAEKQPMVPLSPGKATEEIIASVQESLDKLSDLFQLTPGITSEDKSKLQGIMTSYKELVTENLGAAPGESVKKEIDPQKPDQLPVEAGIANVMPAL